MGEKPEVLPTSNSAAIELHLARLPGIGERILYFNDDFFLGAPVGPQDFWDRKGRPRHRATSKIKSSNGMSKNKWLLSAKHTASVMSKHFKTKNPFFLVQHSPYAFLTKSIEFAWEHFATEVGS